MKSGLLASFGNVEAAVHAARRLRERQIESFEAYGPFPSKELLEIVPAQPSKIPLLMLMGAVAGGFFAYGLQWWTKVTYSLNVGGRPDHSPLAFLPITFETSVLFSGLAGFLGFFLLSGLPKLYQPLFEQEAFERACLDAFLIVIDAQDEHFDPAACRRIFNDCGASVISDFGSPVRGGQE